MEPSCAWLERPTDTAGSAIILPAVPPPVARGGWSGFLQSARTKLYAFYKMPREDFRFSGSPLWLLGSVYGPKSVLQSPQKLTLLLLRSESGLKTIERSYPDKLVSRTFVGMDAIDWLQRRFPHTSRQEQIAAMEMLMRSEFIAPLGSTVTEYVLGGLYFFTSEAEQLSQGDAPMEGRISLKRSGTTPVATPPAAVQDFLAQFHSLFWFSYRQDFPAIEPTQLTTDAGWGCMLRTGQMMLANALVRHLLGREFRLSGASVEQRETLMQVLRLFADRPGPEFPYSIHNIAHVGTLFQKNLGEWFAPSAIANVLKVLVRKYSHAGFTLYLAQERVIYKENVHVLCRATPSHTVPSPRMPSGLLDQSHQLDHGEWRPVIILSCVRLGIETLNPIYVDTLLDMFKIPQMMGIIGGKPNASMYFVGAQDDSVVYLDPHFVQPTVDFDSADCDVSSYHNAHPLKMPIRDLDPCLALAFLCQTPADFEELCATLEKMALTSPASHIVGIGERDPKFGGAKKSDVDPLSHLVF